MEPNKKQLYSLMREKLDTCNPKNWNDISSILMDVKENSPPFKQLSRTEFPRRLRKGIAFFTYDFGIDGVSIEISKYAQSLQDILSSEKKALIHFFYKNYKTFTREQLCLFKIFVRRKFSMNL